MKQALIIILVLGVFGVLLSGGFSLKDPKRLLSSGNVAKVEEGTPTAGDKNLQITNRPVTVIPPTGSTCTSPVAVDLVLDVSGSMAGSNKINLLKTAVTQFGSRFKQGRDLVGIQAFSSSTDESGDFPSMCNNLPACGILQLQEFNSNSYTQAVNQLSAGGNTHMKDGFIEAKKAIEPKRNLSQYKDYKWALVFLSDGIPNDSSDPRSGPDSTQDPTDIRNQIKDMNVRIITIGLDLDAIIAPPANDSTFTKPKSEIPGYARDLITNLATPKAETGGIENYYIVDTASQLPDIYNQIAEKVCNP